MRTGLLLLTLAASLLVAFWASQPPSAKGGEAGATGFSAARAMADIEVIARAPHPTGSAENARVRAYLMERLRALGFQVSTQTVPLSRKAVRRLKHWGDPEAASGRAVNVVGIRPGRDRSAPALLLMAHYDSVWGSPGAADDAAGVAAILEIVRAIEARGGSQRDIVVLFTDAEELGLDGARGFFAGHPLARRVGAVVNLEARGGGGRAVMFETGRGNAAMVDLLRRSVDRPSTNSLSVLVYDLMPNSTDFTIAKERGLAGVNFAFLGRSELYHSPASTPEALDPATLRHLGTQGLGIAHALATADRLPPRTGDAVFGDVLTLFVIAYPPFVGWLLLAVSAALLGFAYLRARRRGALDWARLGGGALAGIALLLHAALLLQAVNLLSRFGGPANYYDRLAALPQLEVQAFLLCLAVLIAAPLVLGRPRRFAALLPAFLPAAVLLILGGWSFAVPALAVAAALSLWFACRLAPGLWGGWLGIAVLVLAAALAVQAVAPTGAALLAWPLLLAAGMAAVAAWADPEVRRLPVLAMLAAGAAVGLAQLLYLAHAIFLGIGHSRPEAMAPITLLAALLVWPILPGACRRSWLAPALLTLAGIGIALSVRFDPIADTIPPYGPDKPAAAGKAR